ncbi:hypothetical protein AMS68_004421 [Peltaster fructicola]|uniref:UDP-glucose:glycoprotein glucosyltransferase n=1 Tax=Peltaster fructicola TaxID=286661 RepID=A0A6H0XW05_9PEZI|nr:hypothetical protein AMS68_004421 [Peltaster fructicola]
MTLLSTTWRAALLFGLTLSAQAAPAIDVEVQAAFPAPPFLLELLETAAEENATSYHPLLTSIANGYFDTYKTDAELYESFRALLKDEGHLGRDDLSSFDLALSLHSAAPRIQAHFQYYNTTIEPSIDQHNSEACESWVYVPFSGQRYCTPSIDEKHAQSAKSLASTDEILPFDRLLGAVNSQQPSILYADITSPSFRQFHKVLSTTAQDGKTSYRVRYRLARDSSTTPLTVSGYGVELALKRTDYIVIDDREAEEKSEREARSATLNDEEVSDLRPLAASEVRNLALNAAAFVLASDDPLETLLKLTQDFPKHSSAIAAGNYSNEFAKEHTANREIVLPPGYNILWINGVQITPRDVDAYSLLEHLRRERRLISNVQKLGLNGPQAIELLTHEAITNSQTDQDVQRYDWRDVNEGGNVIMWLNDLEGDKRYEDWSSSITALMQRTYPGQLPPVARDVHNLILPMDFSNYNDVLEIVDTLQGFVKRKVPIRFGLIPVIKSDNSLEQAKVVYHLLEVYGLAAALDYLENSLKTAGRKYGPPAQKIFAASVETRKVRRDQTALPFADITGAEHLEARIKAAQAWTQRLASTGAVPLFVNGAAIEKTEEWLPAMSQRVSMDARFVQKYLYEQSWTEQLFIPDLFLEHAALRRNVQLVPEDDKTVRHVNIGELPFAELPSWPSGVDTVESELIHLTVATDLDSKQGFELLAAALALRSEHDNIELAVLHVPGSSEQKTVLSGRSLATLAESISKLLQESTWEEVYEGLGSADGTDNVVGHWTKFESIAQAAGILEGQQALILNGRVVGPFGADVSLEQDALESLLSYERKRRLAPAATAIRALGLDDRAKTPLAFATISNLIALSLVSDIPEGIFDAPPTVRTSLHKKWQDQYTSFSVGDAQSSSIHIVAVIDPTSETAQRWTPIINTLSQLDGVHIKLFLNPRGGLEELPVKRFYRYVVEPKPIFDSAGSLQALSARFQGLPADALLNIGMDIPPAWLVAPRDSVHDLDNIKLSAVKSGSDITAIYELEHILIEGHSRDLTVASPPRGVQLVLGTQADPHFAATIVMSNLGYFQFKANPGIYNLALQDGRSAEIFAIDSAGTLGYSAQPGDESTEIALMSFRGATLFPRLSRKSGMEDEDVLEASKTTVENLADQAGKALANAGLAGTQKYLSKAAQLGSKLLSGNKQLGTSQHAEINIFSVASGHLYERMLNIMMLSVMKHTKHTVKFWFIEQFLSPSFKTFLPSLAEEYGFQYEMVTYKWPHWLRGQKEKQREIWGYKILFLDVLFPLDLDKVIFVDADQIVRTDMYELVQHDLQGAPYGFTPMCDSRTEMEGFRFWKQGYWKNYLRGLPYHISALYVVDLKEFRRIAAGDRLRQQYHQLSADPNSLSNLDQDLPNHMQMVLPIHSLPQDWLWCETWCSDEALTTAKTIDLCNNPQTKEPKLDRARRQVPEWTVYDDEIAAVAKRHKDASATGRPVSGDASDAGVQGEEEESIQERLQREDAEKEKSKHLRDEL